jgi:hypothetical protein
MNTLKRVLGVVILTLVFGVILVGTVASLGVVDAAITWVVAIILAIGLIVGMNWTFGLHSTH